MSEIKIEKGVPMPGYGRGGGTGKYPWLEMAVGDSFGAPGTKIASMSRMAGQAAQRAGDGRKFATRTTPEGVRVWRVS